MSKQLNHRTLMHYILDSLGIPKEATHQFNYSDRLDTLMNNNKIKSFVYRRKNDSSLKPTILVGKKIGGQLQIEPHLEDTSPDEVKNLPFLQNTDGYLAVQYENNHTQIHKVGAPFGEENEAVPNDNELISKAKYQLGYRSFTDAGYYQYPLPDSVQNRQNDVLLSLVNQIAQQLQNPFYQTVKLRVSIIKTNSSTVIKPVQEIKTADFHSKKPDVEEYNLTNSNSLDDWEVGIIIHVDAGNQLQSIDYLTAPNYLNEQVGKWKEEAKNRGLEIDIEALRNETLRGFTSPRTKQSFYQRFVQGAKSNLSKAVGGYIEAVQATQKVTKHIWEEGRINESLWYTSSEEYSQWPSYVHPEPILGGVIDGVIDEMFGIPMACKTIYELATDKQKLKALSNIFTQSGLKELLKGLKEELKETINDEEKQDHFAGQSTVSVVSMMSGTGFITKVGKIDEVSKVATKAATEIGEPKAIIALQEVKTPKNKALRNVANEKAMKELAEEAGMDFIAEHADEISDLARFDKIDVSADLWKKLRERGQSFNRIVSNKRPPKYSFHEVEVEVIRKIKGKYETKKYRLDSYDLSDGGKIVSRKATDFDKIQLKTFDNYLLELKNKYPVGAKILTRKYPDELPYGQKTLQGKLYIEVPKSNETSKRLAEFQKLADERGVILIFEAE